MRWNVTGSTGEQLAKRMLKLAWDACGGAFGMGFLQDRGSGVSEDEVWKQAVDGLDYASHQNKPGKVYADYVFGRMMKLSFAWGDGWVEGEDRVGWRRDYQAFCGKYPTFAALVEAAANSLNALISPAA